MFKRPCQILLKLSNSRVTIVPGNRNYIAQMKKVHLRSKVTIPNQTAKKLGKIVTWSF
jgi:RNase P subunit RPR2